MSIAYGIIKDKKRNEIEEKRKNDVIFKGIFFFHISITSNVRRKNNLYSLGASYLYSIYVYGRDLLPLNRMPLITIKKVPIHISVYLDNIYIYYKCYL